MEEITLTFKGKEDLLRLMGALVVARSILQEFKSEDEDLFNRVAEQIKQHIKPEDLE